MTITSAFGDIHCSTASAMAGQLILPPCTGDSVPSKVEVFGGALQEKVGSPLARYGPMLPSCPLWYLNDQDDLGDKGREREVHASVHRV